MFGSDKRTGFLTGTPGGAVTRTPKRTGPLPTPAPRTGTAATQVATRTPTVGAGVSPPKTPVITVNRNGVPNSTPVPQRPVTAMPNPVVARSAPRLSDQNRGTGSIPAPKATPGINVDRFGKVMTPGRGLWSHLTSQMAPGRWFNRG